eukprot:4831763-Amphidinium_carterae.1
MLILVISGSGAPDAQCGHAVAMGTCWLWIGNQMCSSAHVSRLGTKNCTTATAPKSQSRSGLHNTSLSILLPDDYE